MNEHDERKMWEHIDAYETQRRRIHRIQYTIIGVAIALTVALLVAVNVRAANADSTQPELVPDYSADVTVYTDGFGKVVATKHYGPETMNQVLTLPDGPSDGLDPTPDGSGSGGTSSASGCVRAYVNNKETTTLGSTAFWFHTWTYWCWKRSTQVVSNVSTGWSISDVDPFYEWQGIIKTDKGFYDYGTDDGHPKSAYKHYRMGKFANCVIKAVCTYWYPDNMLRSYYNGTWYWATDGDTP